MATNQMFNHGDQFTVPAADVTEPATPESGDALLVGDALPAVALTDIYANGAGVDTITVKTNGVYDLPVEAEAAAVGIGDRLYYDAGDEGLNNSASGNVIFGYALGAVDNGATATIPVKLGH
jgi:predicted RecA/RadA family phage recombinase